MKHKLSACILIPILAVWYSQLRKKRIKMHVMSYSACILIPILAVWYSQLRKKKGLKCM